MDSHADTYIYLKGSRKEGGLSLAFLSSLPSSFSLSTPAFPDLVLTYGISSDRRLRPDHTAALVGKNGSIDWLCWLHFDSPSIFAALLEHEQGAHFQIAPKEEKVTYKQPYWPETNVLITRFLSDDGLAEVIDYMPVGLEAGEPGYHQLIRRVEVIRGAMPLKVA